MSELSEQMHCAPEADGRDQLGNDGTLPDPENSVNPVIKRIMKWVGASLSVFANQWTHIPDHKTETMSNATDDEIGHIDNEIDMTNRKDPRMRADCRQFRDQLQWARAEGQQQSSSSASVTFAPDHRNGDRCSTSDSFEAAHENDCFNSTTYVDDQILTVGSLVKELIKTALDVLAVQQRLVWNGETLDDTALMRELVSPTDRTDCTVLWYDNADVNVFFVEFASDFVSFHDRLQ